MYLDFLLQRSTIGRGITKEGDDLDRCDPVGRMRRIVAAKDSVKKAEITDQTVGQR